MAWIKAYKGFGKDMKCRDFQYEEGKTYELPEGQEAKLCESGFHACEYPLDCLGYYSPAESEYHSVELDATDERRNDDTKRVGKRIKIGTKLSIKNLVEASIEYINEHIDKNNKDSNTGYMSAATNTGDRSAATNAGYMSAATNTGDRSAATNTGDMSAATNTGYMSAATNTGDRSAATNTGHMSAATNTGYMSAATNTGDMSAATNTGDRSAATNTGDMSAATNTGNMSAATNTGNMSAATNTGNMSAATNTGYGGVAIVAGYKSKARGAVGSAICICERGEWNGRTYPLLAIKAAIIDGKTLKPDTWYTLKNGEFAEVEDE